ncbi:uncharacterized protein y4mH-like isoform X2 [Dysidea avara]|uniref:uncharacterized protein y4mH-like isoform X2 n=1 Tax=Dysidea avara TaxID=196820 RepID=UPI00331B1514
MEIVDSHFHLWTPETHPWVGRMKDGGHPAGKFDKIQQYMMEEYGSDCAGHNVTKSVHVQCFYEGKPQDETRWLQNIADTTPNGVPHGIVGYCDLTTDDVEVTLQEHCKYANMRGIRQLLNYHPDKPHYSEVNSDNYLTNPKWLEGLNLCGKHNLSFDLAILPRQMATACDVVKKFPNMQFILNHCGLPYEKEDEARKLWKEGMTRLGQCDNITVKLSGGFATDPKWTHQSAVEVVKDTV